MLTFPSFEIRSPATPVPLPDMVPSLFRRAIAWQTRISRRFDRLLPADFRVDGNLDFLNHLLPSYIAPGAVVYDVGGGKNPAVTPELKSESRLRVIGLDIDASELASAPLGSYDETVVAELCSYRGHADADLVICQALLEHVPDIASALEAIAGILKPGGRALVFVPSRNAVFARINLLLPQGLKRKLLNAVFPEWRQNHGFPAYYDRCTPVLLTRTGARHGLVSEHRRLYFHSEYFRFCSPLHAVWRIWLLVFRALAGAEAAETFSIVFRKEPRS